MTDITIISGFLGAGKTTFANLLLDYHIRRGEKTAYVVNEFGETGLDSALLGSKGFQTTDIFGGCVCCTLRGKIAEALQEVIEQFSPRRIVFEPSGIFVFENFLDILNGPFLKENCRVDSVITIVDSAHVNKAMMVPGNFFSNQVAHADILVVSKLESFAGDIPSLTARLREMNTRAEIVAKPFRELTEGDLSALARDGSEGVSADEEHAHGHGHMDSMTITPRALDSQSLQQLERKLRDGCFGEVYRIKGKVLCDGVPKLLQAAFDSVRLEENPPEGEWELTFIGNHIDGDNIRRDWA